MGKRFKKVYIEITNVCNLSCSFCPKTARPPRFLSVEEFQRVLAQVRPYTDYIYLHLMGEPLLHPELGALLSAAADADLRVNLTTNGTLIRETREILLKAPALRKVGFSLHSFEANQGGGTLEGYLNEILQFSSVAADGGIICELRLWNGDAQERQGENLLNAQILRAVQAWLGSPVPLPDARGSVKLGERLFLGFDSVFDWPCEASAPEGAPVFCHGLRDQLGILADGTAVPCCLDSEGLICLGNLLEQPLAEILEGERATALFDGFSRREAVEPLCKRCGYARRF